MHDVLRTRLLRKIESLPETQVYQVLDYIEFLESKYSRDLKAEASGLQKLAEGIEDRMRRKAMNPANIREAFQLIAAADRVLSSVSSAGRQLLSELNGVIDPRTGEPEEPDVSDRALSGGEAPGPAPKTTDPRSDGEPPQG